MALRLGRALGGGLGAGEVCGAVTGAAILLGLTREAAGDREPQARAEVKLLTRRFLDLFIHGQGSIVCRELLGVDPSTQAGQRQALESDLFRTRCPGFVAAAGQALEQVLAAQALQP